jgi:hypothetical protein
MENYKANHINPETFEQSEIETKIPTDLVNEIQQTLDKLERYFNTPTFIHPEELSVMWGVMDGENKLKYLIKITPNN